jgi:hypothetical protein
MVVGHPRLTLGTVVASTFLGKIEIVSRTWTWAIPGVTSDMVEYALDDVPTLKKVERWGSIEGRDLFHHPHDRKNRNRPSLATPNRMFPWK